jgi:hypothetical protein
MQTITMAGKTFELSTYSVDLLGDNSLQLKDASGAYAQGVAGAWIDPITNNKIMVSNDGFIYCKVVPEITVDPHPFLDPSIEWKIQSTVAKYMTIIHDTTDDIYYKMPVGEQYVYMDNGEYAIVMDNDDHSAEMLMPPLINPAPVNPIIN